MNNSIKNSNMLSGIHSCPSYDMATRIELLDLSIKFHNGVICTIRVPLNSKPAVVVDYLQSLAIHIHDHEKLQ